MQLLCVVVSAAISAPAGFAQQPLNELTLKGTHNSYAAENGSLLDCGWNSCPVMRDAPWDQVDGFGVWALELDFGFENGRLVVGHDGPGCWAPEHLWGYYLDDYLRQLKAARSWSYRPIIVYFEYKQWSGQGAGWVDALEDLVRDQFAASEVFGPKDWTGGWPTVPELKAKLIAIAINPDVSSPWIFTGRDSPTAIPRLPRAGPPTTDHYTCLAYLQTLVGTTTVIATDEYQLNWTYQLVAPPNPICVDRAASRSFEFSTPVSSTKFCEDDNCMIYGGGTLPCDEQSNGPDCYQPNVLACGCTDPTNYGSTYVVRAHGTFTTPYNQIAEAATAAYAGWTLLIKAGVYPEAMTISKAMTLVAEGGAVVIGQ